MKFIRSIFIIVIFTITLGSTKVYATSIPVGVSPETMEFGEFCSWVMLLFGVHGDYNNPSQDYWNDSDFQEYLESNWAQTHLYQTEGVTWQQAMRNCYNDYLKAKYKMAMSRKVYDAISETLSNVFNQLPEITVEFQGDESIGEYTSQSTINQLKSMYNQSLFDELANDTSWNTYWISQQQNIKSIYSNINFYQEYATYTRIQYYIYISRTEDFNLDLANNRLVFQNGMLDRFNIDCYVRTNGVNNAVIAMQTNLNSPITYVNTMDIIYKDNSTYGKILIDAGIQSLIDSDTNTLITTYTDSTTADTIEVAIPADVGRILTDVQDRVISVAQAISQAQAVVVDKADSQAVSQAQASVATSVPEFQTYGLSELFPFCIPFDTIRFLQAFADDPTTPEFDIKLPTGSKDGQGNLVYYEQHVDLHFLDTAASIMRKIELVGFCVLLCKVTRNIMIRS